MRASFLPTCVLVLAACAPGAFQAAAADDPDLSGMPEAFQDADVRAGAQTWFLCAACHQINDGTSHAVGPDLYGVFGRKAGGNETFPLYSPALKAADWIWTPEQVDMWLANPREFLDGTTMIFPGVRSEQDRINVIAYLWVETGAAEAAEDGEEADE